MGGLSTSMFFFAVSRWMRLVWRVLTPIRVAAWSRVICC